MRRKLHTPEQIVKKTRRADAAIASGSTVEQVCKQLGGSESSFATAIFTVRMTGRALWSPSSRP
jgi:hypothetical protein